MDYLVIGALAYLLGSIPTAVWIGRSMYGVDVREHGSKNAGATNTFRVLGKKPGIMVLSIDIFKGFIAASLVVFLKNLLNDQSNEHLIHLQIVGAIAAVIGHVFPIFAGFDGGKGVATSLGVVIGIHPAAAGICLLLFLIIFISSQYVSLGAISAAIVFPLVLIFIFKIESTWLMVFSIILSLAVILAHRKNIKRLLTGTENKMNLFKK